MNEAPSRLTAFREARHRYVTSPQGNLALINTEWIIGDPALPGQRVYGVPGLWAPLHPEAGSGLRVTASASDSIRVDDVIVDGSTIVRGKDSAEPSIVRFSETVTGTVIANEDGDYALRVWDAASEGIHNFGFIDAYDYNPEWVIHARYTPIEGGRAIGIEHLKDQGKTRERVVPADITFSKAGLDYSLAAFQDDGGLLLVFSDATSGHETYGVGRFLRLVPETDETVTIDFNRAYLPPCAFSHHFNCPIPPAHNRLAVAIEAGEKNVVGHDGALLH